MSPITENTRYEAYTMRPGKTRKRDILTILGDREMSARMIAWRLGYTDMNAVRPRLTEMTKEGFVEVCGTVIDNVTGRRVAKYRRLTK